MGKSVWVSMMACLVVAGSAAAGEWVELFDGKTLNGWSVHSGFAKYEVEDGTIVGTAVKGSPNSFLCTDNQYADFVLEFEVKCDPPLNSGVQFRSLIAEKEMVFWFRGAKGEPRKRTIPPDRVHGYQVEIADAERGTSGGVYDEARRGFFLCDVSEDPAASKAFKNNAWNHYRVECRGDAIKTRINDVPCADFRDSLTPQGIIGLQVHGIHGKNFQPYQVRWRNIRIREID